MSFQPTLNGWMLFKANTINGNLMGTYFFSLLICGESLKPKDVNLKSASFSEWQKWKNGTVQPVWPEHKFKSSSPVVMIYDIIHNVIWLLLTIKVIDDYICLVSLSQRVCFMEGNENKDGKFCAAIH